MSIAVVAGRVAGTRTAKRNGAFVVGASGDVLVRFDRPADWKGAVLPGDCRVARDRQAAAPAAPAVLASGPGGAGFVEADPTGTRRFAIDLSSEGRDIAGYAKYVRLRSRFA